MQKIKRYLIVCIVFFIFIIISIFTFYGIEDNLPHFIKKGESLSSNEYFSFLTDTMSKYDQIDNFIFIYLGSICMTCPTGWLVYKIDSLQKEVSNVKYVILLPDEFNENDISNIKSNNSFKLEFINVSSEFQQFINKNISDKNRYPFSGLTIVTNRNSIVLHTEYLNNKGIGLKEKLEKLVNNLSNTQNL